VGLAAARPVLARAVAVAAVAAGIAALTGPASADPPPPVADTLAKLESLPVKGRVPKTGYERSLFGESWTDDVTVALGHNGCDTRNDILRRDLVDVVLKPGSNGCAALSGILNDPYTGTAVEFERGPNTSALVQIDHVVALSDAWQTGAAQLDPFARSNFANDPLNLQTTIGWVNQQKGDADAASWLPPNKAYRCPFVTRIVDIKSAYNLWVTPAEHDAIASVLAQCDA
jgi:hypothetical protein